jgi:DNA sulfur modification protein DndD
MIISSLSMKNFQCYFGEHETNKLEFTDGLNLVIGNNGGGKSKLYDAFYWIIYDEIFVSDTRSMVSTKLYKDKLISDKAKFECEIGGTVTTEVILIAKSAEDKEYKFTRIYKAKKISEREFKADSSSKLLIAEQKACQWQLVSPDKHDHVLERVIPSHIKPYMWFQGEQVDSLMNFTDKSALSQIINLLSDVQNYDDIIDIVNKGSDKAEKALESAQRKLSKDENKSNELALKQGSYRKKVIFYQDNINLYKENLERAKIKIEELVSQISDAKKKAELKSNKSFLSRKYESDEKALEKKLNGFSKKVFQDSWVLKNAEPFFEKFQQKYSDYFSKHNERVNQASRDKIKLPINIPQPIHINKMLEEEICYVCGRKAEKGSEAHEHIKSLINREKQSEELFQNDFSKYFQHLSDNALGFKQLITNVDRSISREFNGIQELRNVLVETKQKIIEINRQFETLLEDDNSENILLSFRKHEENRDKFEKLLKTDEAKLLEYEKRIESVKKELASLVTGNVDVVLEQSDSIFKALKKVAVSTRQEVFYGLICELELSANEIFLSMTEKNNSITGKIKLKRASNGSYIPAIVDNDGYIIHSPNDSNIILVKLSLIMSILTSRAQWSKNFSLISDAPTSKMAKDYTYGFYKTLSERFTQSIVTTYDFLDEDSKVDLKEFNIGNVYQIESEYPSGDRDNRSDLSTKIRKVDLCVN